jgi:hypothetical protein
MPTYYDPDTGEAISSGASANTYYDPDTGEPIAADAGPQPSAWEMQDPATAGLLDFAGDTLGRVKDNVVGLGTAIMNPIDTVKGVAKFSADRAKGAVDALREGDYEHAFTRGVAAIPVLGMGIEQSARDLEQGNYAGLAGDAATAYMLGGAGKMGKTAVTKGPGAMRKAGARVYENALKPKNPIAAEQALPRMIEEGLLPSATKPRGRYQVLPDGTPEGALGPRSDLPLRIKAAEYDIAVAETKHATVPHDVRPIVNSLERLKGQFLTSADTVVGGREALVKEIAKTQRSISAASRGGMVTTEDLVKQRRALDDIAKGKGAFEGVDPSTSATAAKNMADVLREPLNRIPELGKANAEYSYLETATSILQDAPGLMDSVRHGLMAVVNTGRGFKGAAALDAARAGFAPGVRARVGLGMDKVGSWLGGAAPSRQAIPVLRGLDDIPPQPMADRPMFAAGEDGGAMPVNAGAQSMVAPVENAAFRRAVGAADEQALIREMEAAGGEMPAATRGMFAVDETGRALPWNDSAESLAGYSSSDLLRQMFDESMQRDAARLGAGNTMMQSANATTTRALPPAPDPVYAATPDGRISPSTMPGLIREGASTPNNAATTVQSGAAGLRGQMMNPSLGQDVFGYQTAVDRLRSQVQSVPKEVQPQVLATKRAVYRAPDGSMVDIPKGVQQSFFNNFSQGSNAVTNWLDAMRKQGKIRPGGQLVFIDQ